MGRWEPGADSRLADVALELFAERGYERTTVAAIAERAGLTERTFFRYFADKREVLFAGQDALRDALARAVVEAPAERTPLDAIADGLRAVAAAVFDDRLERARRRSAVIAANEELRERELLKFSGLTTALTRALHARGLDEPAATITAATGVTLFRIAFDRWIDSPDDRPMSGLIGESLEQLRAVTAGL